MINNIQVYFPQYFNELILVCRVDFSVFIFSSVAFNRSFSLFITVTKRFHIILLNVQILKMNLKVFMLTKMG